METLIQIIFFLLSALIIGAGVMVVTVRNIIHAALWLIASFFGVGALYLLLEAEFLAVVQVLVYVGAISILILFAIMLTRRITGEGVRQLYQRWWIALIVSATLFAAIIVPTVVNHQWTPPAPPVVTDQPTATSGVVDFGTAFMREYLLPFQIVAILLLVALIGAVVIAYEERARRRRVLTLAEEVELRRQRQDLEPRMKPRLPG